MKPAPPTFPTELLSLRDMLAAGLRCPTELWPLAGPASAVLDNTCFRGVKTDTHYFLYYTIRINRRTYWVNVKMHKDYGEVPYTIERKMPKDLIVGHKKIVTLKTSIPPHTGGANHIRITAAKIQK